MNEVSAPTSWRLTSCAATLTELHGSGGVVVVTPGELAHLRIIAARAGLRLQSRALPAPTAADAAETARRTFEEGASGEGLYPFVTHSFADAEKGAVGIIQVGVPKHFTTMDH